MTVLKPYRPPATALLARILEAPELAGAIRRLPPSALGQLVHSIGLEDAGEIVALASTEQLEQLFDDDLWRSDISGIEEHFDAERFALWLDVLFEAGEAVVVERLVELPFDLVTLAVHRLVLVVDIDALAIEMSEAGDDLQWTEKALESCLAEEWEEFRLISRHTSAWDTVFTALMALDRDHHDLLRRILERCCAMSQEFIEENGGLYDVLTSEQMLEGDALAERDDRRAARGFVSPADARAFLALAATEPEKPGRRDPITAAYFRNLAPGPKRPRTEDRQASTSARKLMHLLTQAQVVESSNSVSALELPGPSAPKEPGAVVGPPKSTSPQPTLPLLRAALTELQTLDPTTYAARLEELGYLANVLIAGQEHQGRRPRPVEALQTAIEICDAALERAVVGKSKRRPAKDPSEATPSRAVEHLLHTPADELFRHEWFARHRPGGGRQCR